MRDDWSKIIEETERQAEKNKADQREFMRREQQYQYRQRVEAFRVQLRIASMLSESLYRAAIKSAKPIRVEL